MDNASNTDEKNVAVKNEEPEVEAHVMMTGPPDVALDIALGAERRDGAVDIAQGKKDIAC